jgi:hypothetical protein
MFWLGLTGSRVVSRISWRLKTGCQFRRRFSHRRVLYLYLNGCYRNETIKINELKIVAETKSGAFPANRQDLLYLL